MVVVIVGEELRVRVVGGGAGISRDITASSR